MPTRTSHSQTEAPSAREEFTPPRFEDERPELNPDRKFGTTESGWEQGARTQSKKKRAAPKKQSKS